MNWHNHSSLKDSHAFLSPSGHVWLKYDDEKLLKTFYNMKAKERGTELHRIAADLINNRIEVRGTKQTFNMHVNDAIGFKMDAEVILVHSGFCFGTADAIGYSVKKRKLRIHDLKTGVLPASMSQLYVYAALFFLEYGEEFDISPKDVDIELRIYQNDEVLKECPTAEDIQNIMDKIRHFDNLLRSEV